MLTNKKMKNIFADKATLVLRKMLKEPENKWVVRDFTGQEGISLGMAQAVLNAMDKLGYAERIKKGPGSYTVFTNKERLLNQWLKEYKFDFNLVDTYYSPDKNILQKIKNMLNLAQYALTLHTGANLITSFVKLEELFIDLYNFQPRGREHAEYLKQLLEEKGKSLD